MKMRLLAIVGVLFLAACPPTGGDDGGASDSGSRDHATGHDTVGHDTVAIDHAGSDAAESDAPVACTPDDSQEENDTPETAKAITAPGTTSDLVSCDDDWFSFTMPANQAVDVTLVFQGNAVEIDVDLYLYLASDPTSYIDSGAGVSNTEIVGALFTSATPVLLKVHKFEGGRAPYTITVAYVSPPANNTCANAVAITPGTSISATTRHAANDYQFADAEISCTNWGTPGPDVAYTVTIPAGQYLIAWLYSEEDLSMYLVDNCTNLCCWAGVDTGHDTEVMVYRNAGGSQQVLYLIVDADHASTEANFGLSVTVGATLSPDAGVEDAGAAVTNCIPNTAPDAGSSDI